MSRRIKQLVRWRHRSHPSSKTCWYRDCGSSKVGLSQWCREHTDQIMEGEHAHVWPLRKGVEWRGRNGELYPCKQCDELPGTERPFTQRKSMGGQS